MSHRISQGNEMREDEVARSPRGSLRGGPVARQKGKEAHTKISAQHTPGPWHWDSDPVKDDEPTGRVRYRVVAKGRTITQCYYPSGDGVAEADARLICAAPDLHDFADAMLTALYLARTLHPSSHVLWDQFIDDARAALAKAST